jgi:hypothetical protein
MDASYVNDTDNEVQMRITNSMEWNIVLLEQLTVNQMVKKLPAFYGSRRLNIVSQEPAIGPNPEPAEFNPYLRTLFSILTLSSIYIDLLYP